MKLGSSTGFLSESEPRWSDDGSIAWIPF